MHSKIVVLIALVFVLSAGCSDEGPMTPRTDSGDVELPEVALQATGTPVQGTIVFTGVTDQGEIFDAGRTTHIRHLVLSISQSGDITGDGFLEEAANFTADGNGAVWGVLRVNAEWQNRAGSLRGKFGGRYHENIFSATLVLHGTGELERPVQTPGSREDFRVGGVRALAEFS